MATDTAEITTTAEAPQSANFEFPKPQAEHEWLQKFVGEWTCETEMACGPDGTPTKTTGRMSVRSLGGFWIQGEIEGETPGGSTATNIMTVGYDIQKGTYVGTFVSSMMDHLWVYHEGTLDGQKLTLVSNGPSFTTPGQTALYHDVVELKSDDYHTLTARVLGDDGAWTEMMTTHYHRKK